MAVNDKIARVLVGHPSHTRCLKGSEIEAGDGNIILNSFLKKGENVNLGQIKEGFISFKGLGATSKLFQKGGFLEKFTSSDAKTYISSGGLFHYTKDNFASIKDKLGDEEVVCLHAIKNLCLSSCSISANKEVQDFKTFCGSIQTVSPIATYEVSIGANLEVMDDCDNLGFQDLIFKEFFDTIKYDKNLPDDFAKQAQAEDFYWVLSFQTKGDGCICNHWLSFKAKITQAGITRDATNPISEFTPTLAVQGQIAHNINCESMEIFGDKKEDEKKKM